jgi:hypothetical protein
MPEISRFFGIVIYMNWALAQARRPLNLIDPLE